MTCGVTGLNISELPNVPKLPEPPTTQFAGLAAACPPLVPKLAAALPVKAIPGVFVQTLVSGWIMYAPVVVPQAGAGGMGLLIPVSCRISPQKLCIHDVALVIPKLRLLILPLEQAASLAPFVVQEAPPTFTVKKAGVPARG